MDKITEHIYLGNWNDSVDIKQLEANNIKCIICINTQKKLPNDMIMYSNMNISHIQIDEPDTSKTNINKYFKTTNTIISLCINRKKNVLVHCTAGISRSATIVIAYMLFDYYLTILNHNISNSKKINTEPNTITQNKLMYVKSKRHMINPNPGFMYQLYEYERMLSFTNLILSMNYL